MNFTLIIIDYFTQLVECGTSKEDAAARTHDKLTAYTKLGYIDGVDCDDISGLIDRLAAI